MSPVRDLDHVQLAIPVGGEERARAFYGELLGLVEIAKPDTLAARGGVWFALGPRQLHLGVEQPFRPARKAHPGLVVDRLDALLDELRTAGVVVVPAEPMCGRCRVHVEDPFGNRVELIEPAG